jgi:hypothetical protein
MTRNIAPNPDVREPELLLHTAKMGRCSEMIPVIPNEASRRANVRTVGVTGLVVCMLLLTGCGRGSGSAGAGQMPTDPSYAQSGQAYYGAPASTLAVRVPGCGRAVTLTRHEVLAEAPALVHAATSIAAAASISHCRLRGHTVLIFTFDTAAAQARTTAALSRAYSFYADGPGWSAAPASIPEPAAQQSIVQDVALSLGGQIRNGRAAAP